MHSKKTYQLTYVYCRNKHNKYSYALNNPIRFTDPSGNDPDPIWSYHNGQYVRKYETPIQRRNRLFRAHQINNIDGAGLPKSENDPLLSMDRMMMRIQERSSFVMKSKFNKQLEYQLQREILKILLEEKSVVPILNISSGKDKLVLLDEFNEADLAFDDIAGSDKTGAPSDEALATFTERMNILSHQWAKDAVAELGGAQSGGGENSTATFWNNVNTGIGAFDVGQGAKGELINYAAKSSPAINDLKYVKGIKALGYGTFGVSSVITVGLAGNYYANGGTNSSVGIKASLDIIMGGVGFLGPIGFGVSATYFLLDAGGAFGGYGDPLLTPKR